MLHLFFCFSAISEKLFRGHRFLLFFTTILEILPKKEFF
ncbi:hypothetical protein HMPREF9124_0719 [Oribacterium sp. oral taxon 108 str. F0425]|nr:hypothetical protein HMPREF9124_0719 [Oribacterium sp. oral taxon 108 str. F0425]